MSPDVKKPRGNGADSRDQVEAGPTAANVPQLDEITRGAVNRERARWHIVLGSIRAQLDEQPSIRARRAAAKRWCAAILAMSDEEAL